MMKNGYYIIKNEYGNEEYIYYSDIFNQLNKKEKEAIENLIDCYEDEIDELKHEVNELNLQLQSMEGE